MCRSLQVDIATSNILHTDLPFIHSFFLTPPSSLYLVSLSLIHHSLSLPLSLSVSLSLSLSLSLYLPCFTLAYFTISSPSLSLSLSFSLSLPLSISFPLSPSFHSRLFHHSLSLSLLCLSADLMSKCHLDILLLFFKLIWCILAV